LIVELYPRGDYIGSKNEKDWEINLENSPNWFEEDKEKYKDRIYKKLFEDIIPRWKKEGISEGLDLSQLGYKKLPNFEKIKVDGSFNCASNQLTSLSGAPSKVGGNFDCASNQLTSLSGAPSKVGGSFHCGSNQLTSLSGAPSKISGDFYCFYNQLTSLSGAPSKVGGNFHCSHNQLTSLSGAPSEVGGNFNCLHNPLTETDITNYLKKIKAKDTKKED
jgi:hypothetical protein